MKLNSIKAGFRERKRWWKVGNWWSKQALLNKGAVNDESKLFWFFRAGWWTKHPLFVSEGGKMEAWMRKMGIPPPFSYCCNIFANILTGTAVTAQSPPLPDVLISGPDNIVQLWLSCKRGESAVINSVTKSSGSFKKLFWKFFFGFFCACFALLSRDRLFCFECRLIVCSSQLFLSCYSIDVNPDLMEKKGYAYSVFEIDFIYHVFRAKKQLSAKRISQRLRAIIINKRIIICTNILSWKNCKPVAVSWFQNSRRILPINDLIKKLSIYFSSLKFTVSNVNIFFFNILNVLLM